MKLKRIQMLLLGAIMLLGISLCSYSMLRNVLNEYEIKASLTNKIKDKAENSEYDVRSAKMSFVSTDLNAYAINPKGEISVQIGGELSGSAEISYLELFADIPLEIGTVICYDGEEAEVTEYDEDLEFYSLRVITDGKFYSQQGNAINVYIKLNLIVTLTATVKPENATNKEVDWFVQWSDNAALKNNPVTDYVTVTPISDGNRTAKVTCKRAFGNDTIIITVKTRDGGLTAECLATFAGNSVRSVNHDDEPYAKYWKRCEK